jgi:hypothetical protein
MMASTNLCLERLTLSEPYTSPKGVKTAQLTIDGEPIAWMPGPLDVAFEPRAFDGSDSRMCLCFLADSATQAALTKIDRAIAELACAHSLQLFGKELKPEIVAEKYFPTLYKKAQYPSMLRAKLVMGGQNATKYRDAATKEQLQEMPAFWRDCQISAKILFKGLWFQGGSFGVTTEVTDVLVDQRRQECPF